MILKNFLSFNEAVQFDMFPNPKRKVLEEHVINREVVPLLKMASIYGPNGAGKSNLIKALTFMNGFVTKKDFLLALKENDDFNRLFFCLKEKIEPISILVEFSNKGAYFIYSVEISKTEVLKESLYKSELGLEKPILIFERKGKKLTVASAALAGVEDATYKMLQRNPLSSLLSLNRDFPILADEQVNTAFEWFDKKLIVIDINSRIPSLIERLLKDQKLLQFANQLFLKVGLGIERLGVAEEDFETWLKGHSDISKHLPEPDKKHRVALFHNNKQTFTIIQNKVYKFLFTQIGENGYLGDLDAMSQSDGTMRLLTLIPALYDAINRDKVVAIDEINNCLHPSIVEGLVRLFACGAKTKGQLIFTTHDIELLDLKDVLRSDEIWFTDKKDGATFMYSHNDFKEHNTISILKGYKDGRFGAIRYME